MVLDCAAGGSKSAFKPPAVVMKLQVNDTGEYQGMQWNCLDIAGGQGAHFLENYKNINDISSEFEGDI